MIKTQKFTDLGMEILLTKKSTVLETLEVGAGLLLVKLLLELQLERLHNVFVIATQT